MFFRWFVLTCNTHMPIVAFFCSGQGSAWGLWRVHRQVDAHTVLCHLSAKTSIDYFCIFCHNSSSVRPESQPTLHSPTELMRLGIPWPKFSLCFEIGTNHASLEHTAVEMLWPCHLCITVWPLSLSSLSLANFPASKHINFKKKCVYLLPTA